MLIKVEQTTGDTFEGGKRFMKCDHVQISLGVRCPSNTWFSFPFFGGQKCKTSFLFSNIKVSGKSRQFSQDIVQKSLSLAFERHTKLLDPTPSSQRPPPPSGGVQTRRFVSLVWSTWKSEVKLSPPRGRPLKNSMSHVFTILYIFKFFFKSRDSIR